LTAPIAQHEVAAIQRDIESAAPDMLAFRVDTDALYEIADSTLTDVVTHKDALVEMRKRATTPLYQGIREVEGWFRPVVQLLEKVERHLKGTRGEGRVLRAQAEREARELAAVAVETNDATALVEALTVASEAGAPPPGRATTRIMWVVEYVDPASLPSEWWCPDLAKLDAYAKACAGEKPVIRGVTFREHAQIGAKR
jgi:hypothetical protein